MDKNAFLKKINNGILHGSQKKFSEISGLHKSTVSGIMTGTIPLSDKHIKNISNKTNIPEKTIREAFGITNKYSNSVNGNENKNITQIMDTGGKVNKELELVNERLKTQEAKIESLNLKLDLLLERLTK
jgi:transcriptional regulator with XRE-family HTH domain